jgi:hypothetical protein
LNTKFSWDTATITKPGAVDLQSVVLHELGHSIGLGDLYGKSQFATDKRQVMHGYNGLKRTLGNGDKTGIWAMYG